MGIRCIISYPVISWKLLTQHDKLCPKASSQKLESLLVPGMNGMYTLLGYLDFFASMSRRMGYALRW